jgi:hypothetical protein
VENIVMIMFTAFFATMALLFKACLASLGVLMAVTLFLTFLIALLMSAIGAVLQPT